MNIHIFDGKLQTALADVRPKLARVNVYSREKRGRLFGAVYKRLVEANASTSSTAGARSGLESGLGRRQQHILRTVIAADGTSANYDPTNDVRADDLLVLIAEECLDKEDIARVFNEQLNDMAGGMCAQGRATRLVQIYLALCD